MTTFRKILLLFPLLGGLSIPLVGCTHKSSNEPAAKPDNTPPMPKNGPEASGAPDGGPGPKKGEIAPNINLK